MDSAVQASLSLPATPVGKGTENSFPSPKGLYFLSEAVLSGQCSACADGTGDATVTPIAVKRRPLMCGR